MKFATVMAVMILAAAQSAPGAPPKVFPKGAEALKAALREALSKLEGELTAADLRKVTMLGAAQRQVRDLSPLTNAVSMKSLWLHHNHINNVNNYHSHLHHHHNNNDDDNNW